MCLQAASTTGRWVHLAHSLKNSAYCLHTTKTMACEQIWAGRITADDSICIRISFQPISHISACYCRPCSACLNRKLFIAGFFENKEADAKARGQKLPKKKDPKQEYDNFLKSIADDVQEVEARQEVEAVEAAQDKADQEAFEHGCALGLCTFCTSHVVCCTRTLPFHRV